MNFLLQGLVLETEKKHEINKKTPFGQLQTNADTLQKAIDVCNKTKIFARFSSIFKLSSKQLRSKNQIRSNSTAKKPIATEEARTEKPANKKKSKIFFQQKEKESASKIVDASISSKKDTSAKLPSVPSNNADKSEKQESSSKFFFSFRKVLQLQEDTHNS